MIEGKPPYLPAAWPFAGKENPEDDHKGLTGMGEIHQGVSHVA